jgi:hypothetical protein
MTSLPHHEKGEGRRKDGRQMVVNATATFSCYESSEEAMYNGCLVSVFFINQFAGAYTINTVSTTSPGSGYWGLSVQLLLDQPLGTVCTTSPEAGFSGLSVQFLLGQLLGTVCTISPGARRMGTFCTISPGARLFVAQPVPTLRRIMTRKELGLKKNSI